jgi:hypothetical protein
VARVAQKIGMKNRSANGPVCATVTEVELGAPALRSARYVVKEVVRVVMSDVLKQRNRQDLQDLQDFLIDLNPVNLVNHVYFPEREKW